MHGTLVKRGPFRKQSPGAKLFIFRNVTWIRVWTLVQPQYEYLALLEERSSHSPNLGRPLPMKPEGETCRRY